MGIASADIRKLNETLNVGASDSFVLFRDNKVVRTPTSSVASGVFAIGGNVNKTLAIKTGNYTVVAADGRIEFLITSAAVATLPDPTLNIRKGYYLINNYSSTASVTFSRSINGDSSFALLVGESLDIYSNGIEWMVD